MAMSCNILVAFGGGPPRSVEELADPGPADSLGWPGREPDLAGDPLDVSKRDGPEAPRVDRGDPVVAEDEDLAVGDHLIEGRARRTVARPARTGARRGDKHAVCAVVTA